MDTIEYMNGQEQFREDPAEIVQMHRLVLTFTIRIQQELIITCVKDFFVLTFSMLGIYFSRRHFKLISLFPPENRIRHFVQK